MEAPFSFDRVFDGAIFARVFMSAQRNQVTCLRRHRCFNHLVKNPTACQIERSPKMALSLSGCEFQLWIEAEALEEKAI